MKAASESPTAAEMKAAEDKAELDDWGKQGAGTVAYNSLDRHGHVVAYAQTSEANQNKKSEKQEKKKWATTSGTNKYNQVMIWHICLAHDFNIQGTWFEWAFKFGISYRFHKKSWHSPWSYPEAKQINKIEYMHESLK